MNFITACIPLCLALLGQACRADAETLTVKLSGLRAGEGVVRVMLWRDASGFPTRAEKAVASKSQAVIATESELSFTGLARGSYAAAAYQDLNSNGKLDLSIFGWPVEPTAASNGARGLMGPPSFAAAAFELKEAEQTIRLTFK